MALHPKAARRANDTFGKTDTDMKKKLILSAAGALLLLPVIAGLGSIKGLQIAALIAAGRDQQAPPESVTTASAVAAEWPDSLNAVGTVRAVRGVTVSGELAGVVRAIHFESGAEVAAGDLLLEMDTAAEEAQLRSAQATAELARLNRTRASDLSERQTIARSEADAAEAEFKRAEAQVDSIRTTIEKKRIRAPFSGRLGIRQVDVGQFINPGDPIVSLQAIDSVYLDFSLPQQALPRLATGMEVRVTSDGFEDGDFVGALTAIEPEVNSATRNVRLRATFANPHGRLLPGMFAQVAVVLPVGEQVLTIPATSVLYAPYGDSVFVVEEIAGENGAPSKLAVQQRFVRLGRSRGDFVSVLSGIQAGETVVTTGVFKLRNGSVVAVNNELSPEFQLNPQPSNS
jgi:membrane fusion protein, multidrug efflux system